MACVAGLPNAGGVAPLAFAAPPPCAPASTSATAATCGHRGRRGTRTRNRTRTRAPPPPSAVKKTFSSFSEIIADPATPTLVDFYSLGCGPCLMQAGVLEEVGRELSGRLKVVKLDADKHATLASRYGVQALPTLVVFDAGREVARFVGFRSKEQLEAEVLPYLRG